MSEMADLIITGASRGIGRALAAAVARSSRSTRLVLVARDTERLDAAAAEVRRLGSRAIRVAGDLSTLASARDLGERLARVIEPDATLVQNAGVWPWRRNVTPDGLEAAFAVNCVGPLVLQQCLLERRLLERVMAVSAGLLIKGRFSKQQTPRGEDFSPWRTYCTTKLCFAVAQRDIAARYRDVDFVVVHPGVARTDLGARPGLAGSLLRWVKRWWDAPEVCAGRLQRLLARRRWSTAGEPRWMTEESAAPWPAVAEVPETREDIRATTERYLRQAAEGQAG